MGASEVAAFNRKGYDCSNNDFGSNIPENVENCSVRKSNLQGGKWSSTGYNYTNPFVHTPKPMDTLDMVKINILSVVVLPFRVVCFLFFLVTSYVLASITQHGMTLEDLMQKPLSGWRRRVRKLLQLSMRMFFASASFHYIKIIGKRASVKEAPILTVAPHSSFCDAIISVGITDSCPVAKHEVSEYPLLGKIINGLQPVYVLRKDSDSREKAIQGINSRVLSKDNWAQLFIHPEGACTNGSVLIQFKTGAFYPGVPVQPVLIRYPNNYDNLIWTLDGTNASGVIRILWLTLTQLYSKFEIEYLPVYHPSEKEKANAKLFADNVQAVMAKALDIPTSDYSYNEKKTLKRAKQMNIPFYRDIVEIEKALHHLGLLESNKDQELTLKYFSLTSGDEIDLVTLSKYLGIDLNNKMLHQLFDILDHRRNGTISLRSYLLCSFYCKIENEGVIEFLRRITKLYTPSSRSISRECFNKIGRHCDKLTPKISDALFRDISHTNEGTITFEDFEVYTMDKPQYAFLFKQQEYIRRPWK